MVDKLAPLFNVRRGEGKRLLLLSGYAFAAMASYVLFSTAAYALFLAEFTVARLPLVYIVSALAVSLFGGLYTWLKGKLPLARLIGSTLVVLTTVTVGVLAAMELTGSRRLVFAVVIWCDVVITLLCLGYWTLAGQLFDIRQSKRLFGLITASELAAGTAAGLSVPLVLRFAQTPLLLWLGAAGLGVCLLFLRAVIRSFGDELAGADAEAESAEAEDGREQIGGDKDLFRGRYVLLTIAFQAIWILAFYILDFAFYDQAGNRYPDEDELAGFIGLFNGLGKGLQLAVTATLSGRLISRYGLKLGLGFPTLVLSAAILALSVAIGLPGGLFFWLLMATRLLYGVFSSTLLNPASRLLYQPLTPARRASLQTFVESILTPLGGGLAGALLLLVGSGEGALPRLIPIMLVIYLGWSLVSMILQREYPAALMSALNDQMLEGEELSLGDATSAAVLHAKLQSPRGGEVLYALALLERIGDEALPEFLLGALEHPAAAVRREALARIEHLQVAGAASRISAMVEDDPSPVVRAAAIGALCELGHFDDDMDRAAPFLDAADPEVARGAIVGLLRGGGIEGVLVAGSRVLEMQYARDPAKRATAAKVLGEIAVRSFYRPVLTLLDDPDVEVRRAAIEAAGKIRHPRLWPSVTAALARRDCRRQASRALIEGGVEAVTALEDSFEQVVANRELERLIVRLCGRIGTDHAVFFLCRRLDAADCDLRLEVLRALRRIGHAVKPEERPGVEVAVERELDEGHRLLAALTCFAEDASLLAGALRLELADAVERVLLQLALILDADLIQSVLENLFDPSKERQAYAVELLDTELSGEIKAALLPLLARQPWRPAVETPPDTASVVERLRWLILEVRKPWTRACALGYAGRERLAALESSMRSAFADEEAVVRESALWALGELAPEDLGKLARFMINDGSSQVRQLAGRLLGHEEAYMAKLLTLERVVFLKAVGIFSEIPEDVLAAVAAVATEAACKAGEPIFAKGDLGRDLYVIVKGSVRIHDGERLIAVLGESEVFGEMAVLESRPRSLSATVEDAALLLVLGREQFWELMNEYPSITRGIVSLLCRRLRESTARGDQE